MYSFELRKPVFLELTPGVAEQIEIQAPPERVLRGLRITLRRGEGGKRTRLKAEIALYHGDISALPQDVDPEPFLEALWNWGR